MSHAPRAAGLAALAIGLALAGCGSPARQDLQLIVIGDRDAPFASHGRLPLAAQLVRAATRQGLVALDDEGRITPALADRWIVTDDGQSYIFRLAEGNWPDGSAITGDNVRQALRQALAGVQHTPLALDLGAIADLRAMAGRVVEIRLRQPMPDFLQLLAQPELGLAHAGRGAGPLAVQRRGDAALLTPIPPDRRGLPVPAGAGPGTHRLVLRGMDAGEAIAAFAAGRADIVLGGSFADLPRAGRTRLGNVLPRLDPVSGLFGLTVTHESGLLADAARREAIAMAIDRDALAAAISLPTLITTTRMVPPGTRDDTGQIDERWLQVSLADRRAEAARRMQAWTAQTHQPAVLRIALPPGPGADLLFDRLAQDLAAIAVQLVRVAADAPADLRLVDAVARYPRMAWFLDALSCAAYPNACSPSADALVERARSIGDPAAAARLYAQAEADLTQENVYIPIGTPIRWSLVAGDGAGFAVNRWGIHGLNALATGDR